VQASQQLANVPTHAVPPFGALHLSMPDLVEHFVWPLALVRQQVTNPGLPQVERAAHFTTAPLQLWFASVAFACCVAHLTYWPWFVEPAQSQLQFNATAARAAAMSAASTPVASHLAYARGVAKTSPRAPVSLPLLRLSIA
jgi:hypothetical protein